MIRYLLWVLLIFFAWRIIKTIFTLINRSKSNNSSIPPFANIEEASFEDITNKQNTEHPHSTDNPNEPPPLTKN